MERILIVEDDREFASSLQLALHTAGYLVDLVHSYDDAVVHLQKDTPSLVIVNLVLEGSLLGQRFIEHLRRQRLNVRTVLISGFPELLREVPKLRSMVDKVVQKPFSREHILAMVEQLLTESCPDGGH